MFATPDVGAEGPPLSLQVPHQASLTVRSSAVGLNCAMELFGSFPTGT